MIATDRRVLAALLALADRPVRVPVIGGPPYWKWFPPTPSRGSWFVGSEEARRLWRDHFYVERGEKPQAPRVYVSQKMKIADARCYHWGIVISDHRYRKVRVRDRGPWLRRLLLHELLHWSGYGHDRRFREAAKWLGTW